MAASTEQKLDYLLKKIGYTASKTGLAEDSSLSGTKKAPFAEAIPSPLVTPSTTIWNESALIPTTPPGSDTAQVRVYLAGTSGHRMTVDSTVSGSRAFIAYSTYNNTSTAILGDWIDPQFGDAYIIKVYKGDPNSGGTLLSAAGAGSNDTWFFDYSSGVLNFNGTVIPSGVTDTNIYIVGYRYIGVKGLSTSGITTSGTSTFKDLNVTGISTFAGNINANGNIVGDNATNISGINSVTATSLFANLTGNVSGIATYTSEWIVTSNGSSDYRFTGPGFDATENDPTIYLARGQQYKFTNHMGAHPFEIRTAINGSAYNDGIVNNGVSNGTLTWDVQMDAPNVLYYQCTAHAGMVGKIYIGNSGNSINVGSGVTITGGGIDVTGVITATSFSGTLQTAAQPNITSVGTLSSLNVTGDVSIGGTLTYEDVTNIDSVGLITARTGIKVLAGGINAVGVVTANSFDGSLATTNLTGTITNAQLAGSIANDKLANSTVSYGGVSLALGETDATPAFNLTDATNYPFTSLTGITTTILGDATPKLGGDLNGNSKNIFGVGVLTATTFSGDISGVGATFTSITGTLITAAQTNITSVGTLGALTVSGNINANGNIVGDNSTNISGINSVTATTYFGDGTKLIGVSTAGISTEGTTTLNNLEVAGISTFAGLVNINGNLQAAGNVTLGNGTGDNIDVQGRFVRELVPSSNGDKDLGTSSFRWGTLHVKNILQSGGGISTFTNDINANGNIVGDNATNISGINSVTATNFFGNISGVGATFTNITGTLQTAAQTNITSVGTLSAVTVSGNINANGNIVGDSATNITGIAGVTASTLTGTLQTAAQPNVTSLGTLTSLNVTGDVSIGGTLTYEDVTNIDSVGIVTARTGIKVLAGGINAVGVVTGTNGLSGTILTAAQTNITSVGTLSFLGVAGNIQANGHIQGDTNTNILGINSVTATTYFGNISGVGATFTNITGTLQTAAQPNITSLGTLGSLTVSGNINANGNIVGDNSTNISGINSVTATTFFGDGSSLTGIAATDNVRTNSLVVSGISTFSDDVNFTSANSNNLLFDKSDNSLKFGDSVRAKFGASTDMEIYHTTASGGTNFVKGTGNLTLQSNVIVLEGQSGDDALRIDAAGGSVKIYHPGSGERFRTTADGINVTGDITGTGDLTLTDTDTGSSAGPELKLFRNSASPADADYLGQIKFAGESDTGVERNYAKITGKILDASNGTEDGIIEFAHIKAGAQTITGRFRSDSLQLLNSTNLSVNGTTTFEDDVTFTGASNNIVFDASDNALEFADDAKAKFGTGGDLEIYHDGSNSYISDSGTGALTIEASTLLIENAAGNQNMIQAHQSGAVNLYYANSKKFETTNTGVVVTGILTATSFSGDGSNLSNVGFTTSVGTFNASSGVATIDSFAYATEDYKVAEYTLHFTNGSDIQAQKLLVMQDGSTAYSQEFAVMSSASQLVSLDATISGSNVLVRATPESGISGTTTFRWRRIVQE